MTPERYQQLVDLYVAAREVAPEQRPGFLTEACRGDETLQEVIESLLEFDAQAESFLDGAALDVTARAVAAEQSASPLDRRVGHYQIQSLLGSGGMGEVYLAHDPRLGRDVALKIIHVAFATDADRLRRFEQEARTAGKLNHPNVVTVYDIGIDQGAPYIVTELLEGEELREQLNRGVPPFKRALDYARQIANGLAAAHAKDIVHRDLKPENIFITSDGRVKILDFGLAKLKPVGSGVLTNQQPITEPGVILGTVGYMSPEQVRGQEIYGGSDIFAFGVILYEMLAGRRPFVGELPVEIMNAILKEEPPELNGTNSKIPQMLQKIVRRCLEKKPEQRFQSASDLGFALDALSTSQTTSDAAAMLAKRPLPKLRVNWLVPVIAILITAGLLAWRLDRLDYWWRNPLADAQFTRLTDFPGDEGHAAISRDGKFVAFLSDQDGPSDIWTGQIGAAEFINLTKGRATDMGNPRVRNVGFSPDGSQVNFWVRIMGQANIWAVPTLGGQLRPQLEAAEFAWSSDGTKIVYHTDTAGDPIFVTESNGTAGKQIYAAERGVHCHFPVWSPNGDFIYFVRGFPPDEMDVWRIPRAGGSAERLTFHNSRVTYPTLLNERTLLYTTLGEDGSGPWLYGMDVEHRAPHRISFGVEQYTSLAASTDGRKLVTTVANPDNSLWRMPVSDRVVDESAARRVSLPSTRALSPRLSPGYMLYLSSKGGNDGIWKLADGTAMELWKGSFGRVLEGVAISPDGSRIAFTAQKGGRNRLYVMNSNGTSVKEHAETLSIRGSPAWPPAGDWVTVAADPGKGPGIFNIPLDGGPPIELVEGASANPVWSPDGRLLVYSGAEVGTTFPLKAVTAEGKPHDLPQLILSRGASRFSFLPGRPVLILLKGEIWHKNFWSVDILTGEEHQLTNFSREFLIGDFDISPGGREIVFGRLKENSNIVLIELPER